MKGRREARELALQILYQAEMKGNPPEVPEATSGGAISGDATVAFTTSLVEGICRNKKEIDQLIEKRSSHWRLNRMAVVDRNILRLSVYELLYEGEVPTSVILNEGIEIAKKFGTEESGSFINGILDGIAKEVRKTND